MTMDNPTAMVKIPASTIKIRVSVSSQSTSMVTTIQKYPFNVRKFELISC
ncbi:unknown [Firmicutes bacterium CAG:65]|nr:unknown [Firmicutes bacterium CAG:65]